MIDLTGRHPSVQSVARWFGYEHLPEDLQGASRLFHDLASEIVDQMGDSPELTKCLDFLLYAKDWFVRCAVAERNDT